jgi:hypothetical protein
MSEVPVSVRTPVDALEQFVRGGLARAGLPLEDFELDIIRFADDLYGPEIQALMEADQQGIWPEHDLDPSRAPTS